MSLMWIKVSEKPMLESDWFIGGFLGVYAAVVIALSLVNGVVNAVRVGWFYPAASRRLFAWSAIYVVLAPFVLVLTGGSVHQILDMDLGRTPVAPMLLMLFLLAALGAVIGVCFTLMYLQPIFTVLLAVSGGSRYSRVRRDLSLPASRAAVVSRGVLVMLVPVFAISVTFALGPWKSDRYGFVAQSSEGIVRWLFSGDFSPISVIAWTSLAAIIVCGIVAGLAFSRTEE